MATEEGESDNSSSNHDDCEDQSSNESSSDHEGLTDMVGTSSGKDGLADMMSKILHQQVKGKNPVLAKRKTAIMKDLEAGDEDTERIKKIKMEKKASREKQLHVPDHTSVDYERQLRRLATRGVVALFNAISKSKRDSIAAEEDKTAKVVPQQIDEAKVAKKNFLEMIQSDKCEIAALPVSNGAESMFKATAPVTKQKGSIKGNEPKGSSQQGWAVLQDDLFVSKSLSLKNWDRDDGDSEDDDGAQ